MEKQLKLRVRLTRTRPGFYRVFGEQYDGTPFSLVTGEHNVVLTDEPESEGAAGWLLVEQYAKQADRCAILLPAPSLEFGHHITVRDVKLMPVSATLDMFRSEHGCGSGK